MESAQFLRRQVPNGRRRSECWLVPENFCFFLPNQKAERHQPFGTGLVRNCPQGLFSPFFTFLRAIFFRPFRLSPRPTICPWVSEDANEGVRKTCVSKNFAPFSKSRKLFWFWVLKSRFRVWCNFLVLNRVYFFLGFVIFSFDFEESIWSSLRKQPTFGDATTGFPAKWCLRNERRNSILMTRHYQDLGSASDWSCRMGTNQPEALPRSW